MENNEDVRSLLEDVMIKDLQKLKDDNEKLTEASKKFLIEEINSIGRIRNEEFKSEAEVYDRELKMELDAEKAKEEKKRFWITTGISLGSLLGTFGMILRTLKIEETGVVTTKALPMIQKLLGKKF